MILIITLWLRLLLSTLVLLGSFVTLPEVAPNGQRLTRLLATTALIVLGVDLPLALVAALLIAWWLCVQPAAPPV